MGRKNKGKRARIESMAGSRTSTAPSSSSSSAMSPSSPKKTNSCHCKQTVDRLIEEGTAIQDGTRHCSQCRGETLASWVCVHCEEAFCGNRHNNHVLFHTRKSSGHVVFMDIVKRSLLCFECKQEVREGLLSRFSISPQEEESSVETSALILKTDRDSGISLSSPSSPSLSRKFVPTQGRPLEKDAVQNRAICTAIEEEFDMDCPRGLTGLSNLGNTCYMNAALQSLSNIPPLSDFFRSHSNLRPYAANGHIQLSTAFGQLLQRLWSPSRSPSITPYSMLSTVRDTYPQFRGWAQQDSQEFLRCLLDSLHSELLQPVYLHETFLSTRPRRSSSSSSSSSSQGSEHFETADSGWSSDGEVSISKKALAARKRTRSDTVHISPVPGPSHKKNNGRRAATDLVEYRSIISEVFNGRLESSVKCLSCHTVSTTTEIFQDLSLPIPSRELIDHMRSLRQEHSIGELDVSQSWLSWLGGGTLWRWLSLLSSYLLPHSASLDDCLAAFFSPDRLIGDDMYSCEKCKKLRNGVKMCRITKLPEVLCVHLKRFRHDTFSSSKVSTRVSFPLVGLDLAAFVDSKDDVGQTSYDLCAFISHEGGSSDSGHYIAYCRNEIDGNWYEYDDATVTKLDDAYVLTKEAYVLFYQKAATPATDLVRRRVEALLSPQAIARSGHPHFYVSTEWMERLMTFVEPGPVTNYSFLCPHSHILPSRAEHIGTLCTAVSAPLWNLLVQQFGGGPAVNELHYCRECERRWQWKKAKRHTEKTRYTQLDEAVKAASLHAPDVLYSCYLPPSLISRKWFNDWTKFINDPYAEPPGPIDNKALLVELPDGRMKLKDTANVIKIPRELFLFFRGLYGGGPEVLLTEMEQPTEDELRELVSRAEAKKSVVEARHKSMVSGESRDD